MLDCFCDMLFLRTFGVVERNVDGSIVYSLLFCGWRYDDAGLACAAIDCDDEQLRIGIGRRWLGNDNVMLLQ